MKKIIMSTILTLPALSLSAQHFTYPETPRDNTVDHYFGVAVADPYRWWRTTPAARPPNGWRRRTR